MLYTGHVERETGIGETFGDFWVIRRGSYGTTKLGEEVAFHTEVKRYFLEIDQ